MSEVVFITGPSGAGKSTTAKELTETQIETWALISQDHIRTFIKAGYANPEAEWTGETKKQWSVSIAICCDMAKRYHEAGINCVIELFAPPTEFEKWKQYLDVLPYKLFVLLPDVEKTVYRNSNRKLPMKEEDVRENHEWFTEWKPSEATIIDTTDLSLDESVEEISRCLRHGEQT